MSLDLIGVIFAMSVATMISRFAPFILFGKKTDSPHLDYLGRYFPASMMGILVLYCLKDVRWAAGGGRAELAAILFIVSLQAWKRNSLLSIFLGTGLYMILLRI